jgi:hypothetical protein
MYRVIALCDVSAQSVSHCANKYKVQATYTDMYVLPWLSPYIFLTALRSDMLVGSPEIDVVFVLNAK